MVPYAQKVTRIPTAMGNPVDPFDTSCLEINATTHQLLQYYSRVFHRVIWYPEPSNLSVAKSDFQHDADFVLTSCLGDEMKMYSILSNMASQLLNLGHLNLSQSTKFFIHKAIIATQRTICNQPLLDQSMLYWLFHLGCAEWYRSNFEAALIHLQGMKSIYDRMGGTTVLDEGLRTVIALSDVFNSGALLVQPTFPCDYDPGRAPYLEQFGLQELFQSEVANSVLLSSTCQRIVPNEVHEFVNGLMEYAFLHENAVLRSPAASENEEFTHWMHLRWLTMNQKILALQLEDSRPMFISVAVGIWSNIILPLHVCLMLGEAMAVRLDHRMKANTPNWEGHEEVLMWILMIGAMATINHKSAHDSFLQEILSLIKHGNGCALFGNNMVDEEGLQLFMGRFPSTKAIWPEVLVLGKKIEDLMHM